MYSTYLHRAAIQVDLRRAKVRQIRDHRLRAAVEAQPARGGAGVSVVGRGVGEKVGSQVLHSRLARVVEGAVPVVVNLGQARVTTERGRVGQQRLPELLVVRQRREQQRGRAADHQIGRQRERRGSRPVEARPDVGQVRSLAFFAWTVAVPAAAAAAAAATGRAARRRCRGLH